MECMTCPFCDFNVKNGERYCMYARKRVERGDICPFDTPENNRKTERSDTYGM